MQSTTLYDEWVAQFIGGSLAWQLENQESDHLFERRHPIPQNIYRQSPDLIEEILL